MIKLKTIPNNKKVEKKNTCKHEWYFVPEMGGGFFACKKKDCNATTQFR